MSAAHNPGGQCEECEGFCLRPTYRVTVYANDITGRQLEEFIVTDLAHVGRWVARAFDTWADANQEIRCIVAKVAA